MFSLPTLVWVQSLHGHVVIVPALGNTSSRTRHGMCDCTMVLMDTFLCVLRDGSRVPASAYHSHHQGHPPIPDRTAEEAVLSSHIANSVFSTLQLPRPQREQRLSEHLVNQEERGHQLLSLSTCPECLMKEPLLPSGLAVQGYFMWPRMSVRVSKYPFLVWIVAVLAFGMFRILVARTHKISWKEAG